MNEHRVAWGLVAIRALFYLAAIRVGFDALEFSAEDRWGWAAAQVAVLAFLLWVRPGIWLLADLGGDVAKHARRTRR